MTRLEVRYKCNRQMMVVVVVGVSAGRQLWLRPLAPAVRSVGAEVPVSEVSCCAATQKHNAERHAYSSALCRVTPKNTVHLLLYIRIQRHIDIHVILYFLTFFIFLHCLLSFFAFYRLIPAAVFTVNIVNIPTPPTQRRGQPS